MACYFAVQDIVYPMDQPESSYCMTTTPHHALDTLAKPKLWIEYYLCIIGEVEKTVEDYVQSRRICQQTKARNHKPYGLLLPIEPPESKWEVITMDFIIPLPQTKNGNSGILNVVCTLSKMIRIIYIKTNITAPKFAMKFKENFCHNHGLHQKSYPIAIVSSWANSGRHYLSLLAPI